MSQYTQAPNAIFSPPRRGWLRHGNRPGDYAKAPRCGARTRSGGCCGQPAMRNGRCRMHGGLSTGPRTPEGLDRARRARWKHGYASAETRALRRLVAATCRDLAASVRLARSEIRRRCASSGRLRTAGPSSGGVVSSLGMGSIERNSTSPPIPLDDPWQDSPASQKGDVAYVGATCGRPSDEPVATGDRRSPLQIADVQDVPSSDSSLGMGWIARNRPFAGPAAGPIPPYLRPSPSRRRIGYASAQPSSLPGPPGAPLT
jgi:glucans biosynthesis protein